MRGDGGQHTGLSRVPVPTSQTGNSGSIGYWVKYIEMSFFNSRKQTVKVGLSTAPSSPAQETLKGPQIANYFQVTIWIQEQSLRRFLETPKYP